MLENRRASIRKEGLSDDVWERECNNLILSSALSLLNDASMLGKDLKHVRSQQEELITTDLQLRHMEDVDCWMTSPERAEGIRYGDIGVLILETSLRIYKMLD